MNKYAKQAKAIRRAKKKERMCLNKVAYDSELEATQTGQRTYRCPHCGKWHRSGTFARFVNKLKNKAL